MDWIDELKPRFSKICSDNGWKCGHDTHYDARNFLFSRVKGNRIHRIDFQPKLDGSIHVTQITETYPMFPWLFEFLRDWIPLFPYQGKVEYQTMDEIQPPFEHLTFEKQVSKIVRNAI